MGRGEAKEEGRSQIIQDVHVQELDSILSSVGNDLLFLHRVGTLPDLCSRNITMIASIYEWAGGREAKVEMGRPVRKLFQSRGERWSLLFSG